MTQDSSAVVDSTSVTIAVTILSQNTSALQSETVSIIVALINTHAAVVNMANVVFVYNTCIIII